MVNSQAGHAQNVAVEIIDIIPRLNRWAQAHVTNGSSEYNVSLRQLSALGMIENEKTTLGDVARHLGVTPAVVTGLIDRLEQRGYVERVNSTEDRRKIELRLTTEGQAASVKARQHLADQLQQELARLPDAELQDVAGALQRLQAVTASLEGN